MMFAVSITADRLTEALRLRDTDQSELAREIGVTQGAISKIIVGKTVNSRLLPRIASHLGVPLDWLLGNSNSLEDDGDAHISRVEQDLVMMIRALAPRDRDAIIQLARSLTMRVRPPTLHDKQHTYRAEG